VDFERTLLDNIKAGGYPGYVIILLGLIGIGLVVAYAIIVRRGALIPPLFVSKLEQAMNSGDVDTARELCVRATALRNVLFAGLGRLDDGPEVAARAEHLAAERERLALKRFTGWLLLIAVSAALIGAFGSVSCFVWVLDKIANPASRYHGHDMLESYSMALIRGYMGLLVAIPLFPAWWFFSSRAGMLAHEIEMTADDLIGRVANASPRKDQPTTEPLETT